MSLSKPNTWDQAKKLRLTRLEHVFGDKYKSVKIDPGVNFFVAMLNQLGCRTHWSCEGHPKGFYVIFRAPYSLALKISQCGFFHVEIEWQKDIWAIRMDDRDGTVSGPVTLSRHRDRLRYAADAWEKKFGELNWKKIVRKERGPWQKR